tara:strand:+ start:1891 stop:2178 length:288 start_codon:yes stop_codon:yes gene_type:complete
MKRFTRRIAAHLITPILALTGFRFSKDYRHGIMIWDGSTNQWIPTKRPYKTFFKNLVYCFVDTVTANINADKFSNKQDDSKIMIWDGTTNQWIEE